jgi:Tfp pilus assembly protein PilF
MVEQALQDLSSAIGTDSTNSQAYEFRARLYAYMQQPDKAAADEQAFMRLQQAGMSSFTIGSSK